MSQFYANTNIVKTYMETGANVLLVGAHGIGKTSILKQAADELGWTMAMFNGATIDPYIDLLGIPVASGDGNDNAEDRELQMIQKKGVLDAEVIFIDEWNRAPKPVVNALMELINDRSVNGKKLENLKCVVAAMNPPESDVNGSRYSVSAVDPAQMDRFHVVLKMSHKANRTIIKKSLAGVGGYDKEITDAVANVLVDWQHSLVPTSGGKSRAPYISPRRVDRLGQLFLKIPTMQTVYHGLGMDADALNYETLYRKLSEVINGAVDCDVDDMEDMLVRALVTSHNTGSDATDALNTVFDTDNIDPLSETKLDMANVSEKLVEKVGADVARDMLVNVLGGFLQSPEGKRVPGAGSIRVNAMREATKL